MIIELVPLLISSAVMADSMFKRQLDLGGLFFRSY